MLNSLTQQTLGSMNEGKPSLVDVDLVEKAIQQYTVLILYYEQRNDVGIAFVDSCRRSLSLCQSLYVATKEADAIQAKMNAAAKIRLCSQRQAEFKVLNSERILNLDRRVSIRSELREEKLFRKQMKNPH